MNVQITIKYGIDDAIRELDPDGDFPQGDGVIVSMMQDKFFKGGGCEAFWPGPEDSSHGDMVPRNIAACMKSEL